MAGARAPRPDYTLMKNFVLEENRKFCCILCGKEYGTSTACLHHIRLKHRTEVLEPHPAEQGTVCLIYKLNFVNGFPQHMK